MAQANINIRMNDDLKQQFDWLCNKLGLNITAVINTFAKTMACQQKIPFEVGLDIPNSETLAATDDINHGRSLSKAFYNVTELMEDSNT